MNIKKRFLVSLVTALVFAALSAFSVSASAPGYSTEGNGESSIVDSSTVSTGDNGVSTTIAIFSIMAAVSLGTAVVATKVKKASK